MMEASDPCHNIVGNGTSHLRLGLFVPRLIDLT
jgi:hypothetical protein